MLDWFYLLNISATDALEGFDKLLKEGLKLCNKVSDDVDYCPFAVTFAEVAEVHIKDISETV